MIIDDVGLSRGAQIKGRADGILAESILSLSPLSRLWAAGIGRGVSVASIVRNGVMQCMALNLCSAEDAVIFPQITCEVVYLIDCQIDYTLR